MALTKLKLMLADAKKKKAGDGRRRRDLQGPAKLVFEGVLSVCLVMKNTDCFHNHGQTLLSEFAFFKFFKQKLSIT